ncbi:transglutaminase family protein [Ilumatobacter nonamiensis]|uniref:transglutaminase family protein n=1 Tax=Ilumatobacter nonamiensis TaxID=467093 RepID=UPI0011D29145|nr:transglutaminaseTgpA domain-containing protein [Ilumatobacter nonamiensis]
MDRGDGVIGLIRARLIVITVMMCVVGLAAGAVFDQPIWSFALVPAIVGVGEWVVFDRRWGARLATGLATSVAAVATVVFIVGGTTADFLASLGPGTQRILSTEWPSPERPDLVGTVATVLAVASLSAVELTRRERFHLSPLIPVAAAQILVIALSAPRGVNLWWTLFLALLAALFAVLRPGVDGRLSERLGLLRGERRLVPTASIAIVAAGLVAIPVSLDDRADPRDTKPAAASAAVIDPIEATLALQTIEPPIELHDIAVIDSTEDDRIPHLWRTSALSRYDGRRWSPSVVLRPIGRRLSGAEREFIEYTVTFENDDLRLFPLPGAPIVIDAPTETDEDRTLVALVDRPVLGEQYPVTAHVDPDTEDALGAIGISEDDENGTALVEVAEELAEQGGAEATTDFLEQLRAIEATMRNDFVLRTDAPGGGLQRLLIERFLRETRRGNSEQFATAFVLLARSLGVEARVATGYRIDPEQIGTDGDASTFTILSSDADVWPEVRIGTDWVAFDPVPENENTDSTPPPMEPQVQTPAAPQPPIDPPPEATDEPVVTEDDADADTSSGLPTVVTYALYVGAGVAALLVPIILFVVVVLGAKWRRRRRRLSGSPRERVGGAWSLATNALVDGGMSIAAANTNDEIADKSERFAPNARTEVHRLATLASTTTFGDPQHPEHLADDATSCLYAVESTMRSERTRRQRIRWRLSLRSLRRQTRSPV